MNVLQLVPRLNIGGVERGTVEVARFLALNGHKAIVVSAGGRLEKNLAQVGARHYNLPVGKKNPLSGIFCYFKLRRIIRKENIDIIHARSRIPALIGYFAARSEKRIFITTAHGQYRKHFISRVMGWGKIVIVASDVMFQHMKNNFGIPDEKMVIIPRGVDLKKFNYSPPREVENRKFRIGMVSRFTPIKGHLDFLKAAAYVSRKIPQLEIVIMGDRNNANKDYLRKIDLSVKHLLIGKNVKFISSDEDVSEIMKSLDVFISASKGQEAFGRAIIEAQASGTPVVATKVGGVIETVQDGVTGLLCEANNPHDMAQKILKYSESLKLRQKIAEKARTNVEEEFSLDIMLGSTLKVYEEALKNKNILIFKISSFGDIILSVPSLRAIRKRFPNALIKILVDVKFRKILKGCPYVDEILVSDFAGRDRGKGIFKLAETLRGESFDISIDLQNNRHSHLLAFLSSIPERVGYDNKKLSFFLNRKAKMPKKAMNPIDHQGKVLSMLGIKIQDKTLELWPQKESNEWVEKFLTSNWLKPGEKLVGISFSASKKWETKNWGLPSFQHLAEMLAREKNIRVILLGSGEDAEKARLFVKRTTAKPINAVGKTNIPQLVSLIARCNALVSGDSSPMHIAAAVGVPFVGIFGPTDPKRHVPPMQPGQKFKIIKKSLKCGPCYKSSCYLGHKCMQAIKPREVFEALMSVIK